MKIKKNNASHKVVVQKMRHSLIVLGAFRRESKEGSSINFFDFPNQFID